jgi:hypothetical protein
MDASNSHVVACFRSRTQPGRGARETATFPPTRASTLLLLESSFPLIIRLSDRLFGRWEAPRLNDPVILRRAVLATEVVSLALAGRNETIAA